ncbi:MAG TPA: glycoside hydrolase domain-containing protein [Stellaceae bacterium]|nr:glycoside hydrolase domain-containing protein [Stellaceae bacterium]
MRNVGETCSKLFGSIGGGREARRCYLTWTIRAAWVLLASSMAGGSPVRANEYCVQDPRVAAADLATPVDQSFLHTMNDIGVKTVIRYFDYEQETLPGKTLRPYERDIILSNGLKLAVVFQHHNDRIGSFTAARGRQDAERSLFLAYENGQPPGSAIYFGVDGNWQSGYQLNNIATYFREVNAVLRGVGYRVGVYGSGLVCNMLLSNALADLCWLGAPTSWPQYYDYYMTKKWNLVQLPTAQCGGRSVDFNLANGVDADYGQFGN